MDERHLLHWGLEENLEFERKGARDSEKEKKMKEERNEQRGDWEKEKKIGRLVASKERKRRMKRRRWRKPKNE